MTDRATNWLERMTSLVSGWQLAGLIDFGTRAPYHFGPFGAFFAYQLTELLRRSARRVGADQCEFFPEPRRCNRTVDFGVESGDDRRRHSDRRDDAGPGGCFIARHAGFRNGRQLRQGAPTS